MGHSPTSKNHFDCVLLQLICRRFLTEFSQKFHSVQHLRLSSKGSRFLSVNEGSTAKLGRPLHIQNFPVPTDSVPASSTPSRRANVPGTRPNMSGKPSQLNRSRTTYRADEQGSSSRYRAGTGNRSKFVLTPNVILPTVSQEWSSAAYSRISWSRLSRAANKLPVKYCSMVVAKSAGSSGLNRNPLLLLDQ